MPMFKCIFGWTSELLLEKKKNATGHKVIRIQTFAYKTGHTLSKDNDEASVCVSKADTMYSFPVMAA